MGYYTAYSLKWSNPAFDEGIGNAIEKSSEMSYVFSREGDPEDSSKWYDHEAEMKVFSLAFPGVLFTLHGEGEESGDIWNKYFLDGKVQVAKAKLDIPEFNAKLLV